MLVKRKTVNLKKKTKPKPTKPKRKARKPMTTHSKDKDDKASVNPTHPPQVSNPIVGGGGIKPPTNVGDGEGISKPGSPPVKPTLPVPPELAPGQPAYELKKLTEENAAMKAEITALKAENDRLKAEVEASNSKITELTQAAITADAHAQAQRSTISGLEYEIKLLKAENETLKQAAKDLEARLTLANERLAALGAEGF